MMAVDSHTGLERASENSAKLGGVDSQARLPRQWVGGHVNEASLKEGGCLSQMWS
jgi:hypothetical protein